MHVQLGNDILQHLNGSSIAYLVLSEFHANDSLVYFNYTVLNQNRRQPPLGQ
jgi:hypothetical protein